jgi:hypothetical protein
MEMRHVTDYCHNKNSNLSLDAIPMKTYYRGASAAITGVTHEISGEVKPQYSL